MNFVNFIKSYRMALANALEKVSSWDNIYLSHVDFKEDNVTTYLFTNSYNIEPNTLGIYSSTINDLIERLKCDIDDLQVTIPGGISKTNILREYINRGDKINDVTRILTMLDDIVERLPKLYNISLNECSINGVDFNFEKDLLCLKSDKYSIYTNGIMLLVN